MFLKGIPVKVKLNVALHPSKFRLLWPDNGHMCLCTTRIKKFKLLLFLYEDFSFVWPCIFEQSCVWAKSKSEWERAKKVSSVEMHKVNVYFSLVTSLWIENWISCFFIFLLGAIWFRFRGQDRADAQTLTKGPLDFWSELSLTLKQYSLSEWGINCDKHWTWELF